MDHAQLLTAYDRQVRTSFPDRLPSTWTFTRDGPLVRCTTDQRGFVLAVSGLGDAAPPAIHALVRRTVAHFRRRGLSFEWKTFGHDNPQIVTSLIRHGFEPDRPESLILGNVTPLTGPPIEVPGVVIRQGDVGDLAAVAAMEEEVWGQPWAWFVPEMTALLTAADPTNLVLAQTPSGRVVSAGWLVPMRGTSVAGLWGGSTLREYRGRGIYRALVRARANEAARRGYTLLQVDASDQSRRILECLGLPVIGTTTPYRWTRRGGWKVVPGG